MTFPYSLLTPAPSIDRVAKGIGLLRGTLFGIGKRIYKATGMVIKEHGPFFIDWFLAG